MKFDLGATRPVQGQATSMKVQVLYLKVIGTSLLSSELFLLFNRNPLSTSGANKPRLLSWAGLKWAHFTYPAPLPLRETRRISWNLLETANILENS